MHNYVYMYAQLCSPFYLSGSEIKVTCVVFTYTMFNVLVLVFFFLNQF